ncbi:NADP-dependent oxidoreductase [Kitasatospora sp. NBC_00240]|uniref:NADP-dependent oxidoreductase n=1 Tax=Kitasatospora sp. NBC_00240 TaxID=2903567 RepID=UPI0022514A08|nr:NADP-dependent oxidoreductase [Kitasatospora sp. NBC_00240]MCX5212778.1 NADP-dependent oxidoreductase [Kitasatospora sp. NBC_00240]
MSTAIVFNEYGKPEVLVPVEIPDPDAGTGQVRVRVRAAGVQPFDTAWRRGDFAQWNPDTFPVRLGNEVAGVVDQVGRGVTGVAVGDEVIGFLDGTGYSAVVLLRADQLVHKPAGMPWEEAGVLSASGQTAHSAMDELRVGAGDVVLIHAAAGGVGSNAVQIARARGAVVIGTAGERNHEYLRSLGAIPVTYGAGLVERVRAAAPDGVDAVFDAVGGEALDASVEILDGNTERAVTIADSWGGPRLGVRRIGTRRSAERLADLVRLHREGLLRVTVAGAVPLERASEAHREVETGHVRGKVVLTVG